MIKEISILGRKIKISFCMAVQIAYEDITNKPFRLEDLSTKRNLLALDMAAIIVSNPDTDITMDMLANEGTFDDFVALDKAVSECLTDWFKIPFNAEQKKVEGKSKPIKRP